MSLQVIKQPVTNINGHSSKWSSVHQTIEFQLQRKDFNLINKTKVNGYVRLKISGSIPRSVAVGQNVYYNVSNQKITCKITALIQPNIIVTDSVMNGNFYSGFVNFIDTYKNYFVDTEIFGVTSQNTYVSLGISNNVCTPEGIVKVNVQEWLRTQATYQNDFLYNTINKMIKGEGTKFNVRFRENFNGNTFPFTTLSDTNIFYWINSAKQIQEMYGMNMGDYVPTLEDARTDKAKFQTVFKKPTYFPGYPFSLNFIYSDNLLNYNIYRKEKTYNQNGVEVVNTSDVLTLSQRANANRLMLKQGYTSNVKTVDLWLETGTLNTNDNIANNNIYVPNVFEPNTPRTPINITPIYIK